jgi:hypothetical protein
MAKNRKDFSDIASDNKNLGGVSAVFGNAPKDTAQSTKRKTEEFETDESEELEQYNLRIESYIMTNLKVRKVNRKISVRDQIIEAIVSYWNIEAPEKE